MRRKPVDSSNLKSVGYSPTKKVLEIGFKSGSTYRYDNVPKSEHLGLMAAASHGKYHHKNIRTVYPYTRIK